MIEIARSIILLGCKDNEVHKGLLCTVEIARSVLLSGYKD